MNIGKLLGDIFLGPIKDLTETRKAKKAAEMEHIGEIVKAEAAAKIAQAQAAAKIAEQQSQMEADWEAIMAKNSDKSWKDEWFVLILSGPYLMAFIPDARVQRLVAEGFTILENTPDWYKTAFMAAIAASFGLRALAKTPWGKK